MSKSNRLLYAAIGGCLAAGIAYAQPVSNDAGSEQRSAQEKAKPASQAQSPVPFSESVRRIAEAVEAINTRQDSAEESNRAARDLNAQENMAFWAKFMFWVACAQLIVGGITLWLLCLTFRETRRTARGGILAAKAAISANVRERKNFEKLERPYILLTNIAVSKIDGSKIGGSQPRIELVIGNYGKVPAIIDRTLTALVVSPSVERPTPAVQEPPHNLIFASVFSAGETRALSLNVLSTMFVTRRNMHTPFLYEENKEMLLVIEVHYRGPFGGNYTTEIYMRWDWNSDGFVKVDDDRYNKST